MRSITWNLNSLKDTRILVYNNELFSSSPGSENDKRDVTHIFYYVLDTKHVNKDYKCHADNFLHWNACGCLATQQRCMWIALCLNDVLATTRQAERKETGDTEGFYTADISTCPACPAWQWCKWDFINRFEELWPRKEIRRLCLTSWWWWWWWW
jgi:hypothetical protein